MNPFDLSSYSSESRKKHFRAVVVSKEGGRVLEVVLPEGRVNYWFMVEGLLEGTELGRRL